MHNNDRRQFLKQSGLAAAGIALAGSIIAAPKAPFEISLAEWSLHKALFKKEVDNINFAKIARE
ncbi:MAG: twin-arginine translocation signal domain-containing protein, partial [Blastocatellia bacterium]